MMRAGWAITKWKLDFFSSGEKRLGKQEQEPEKQEQDKKYK